MLPREELVRLSHERFVKPDSETFQTRSDSETLTTAGSIARIIYIKMIFLGSGLAPGSRPLGRPLGLSSTFLFHTEEHQENPTAELRRRRPPPPQSSRIAAAIANGSHSSWQCRPGRPQSGEKACQYCRPPGPSSKGAFVSEGRPPGAARWHSVDDRSLPLSRRAACISPRCRCCRVICCFGLSREVRCFCLRHDVCCRCLSHDVQC